MLNADAVRRQETFARQVVTLIPEKQKFGESKAAHLNFPWRLAVYQESFIGRTISALVDAMLEPAIRVFGADCIKEVVARFFAIHPPSASSIDQTLLDLPDFIRKQADGALALALASLIESSLAQWSLLFGADRLAEVQLNGLLGPSALIQAEGNFDLWRLFSDATREGLAAIEAQNESVVDLLLVKTDVDQIVSVPSPRCLLTVSLALVGGKDVACAISSLSPAEAETISDFQLKSYLRSLKESEAL